jgi:ubiquinone/menaquinone biosynthesis C-methylase UbiE
MVGGGADRTGRAQERPAMSFYADRVVPVLIDLAMRNKRLRPYRERIVGAAEGRVLEVGIGSGLNLPLYSASVRQVLGLDPSPGLLTRARQKASRLPVAVELIQGAAEAIPLDDRSVDTVVMTWTGCSIPDVAAALAEMRRVLKPAGRLRFVEHGRAPELGVARWQDWLTPLWRRISGGCHLNRKIDVLIETAGFQFEHLATGYMNGPRPFTFMYEGSARPR